ncbi:MAG: T9SS type A sorting domain-containing protein [Candidatus Latescibacteria bacterium]|nr:T9SS type A sorting domain-containing protein [Candidatus Latescibacterota bacterium]
MFHQYVTFNYEINAPGKIQIKIYDALGKEVKTLTSKDSPVGTHYVIWDGTGSSNEAVQNGLYFYRINFNGINYTGKILKTDL